MQLKKLKVALDNSNAELAADIIANLYIESPDNFKRSLLLSNTLPEPLQINFKEKKLEVLLHSFKLASIQLINKDVNIEKFARDFSEVYQTIKIIHKNLQSNANRLKENNFSDYSISEQLQMFCIYIQDQNRLFRKNQLKHSAKAAYITGMENEVARFKTDDNENLSVSETDNYEGLIETADTLFKYLYYISQETIDKEENFVNKDVSPYHIPSFEEILYLTHQRNLLNLVWGKFKYRKWELRKTGVDDNNIYTFIPASKEEYKKEYIGVRRNSYREFINTQQEHSRNIKENQKSGRYLNTLSKKVDPDEINTLFALEKKEYFKANIFMKNLIKGQIQSLDEIYHTLNYKDLKLDDILKGVEYLYTISEIYQISIEGNFDEENDKEYKKLAPIVDKNSLINHFAEIYRLEKHISEKIINIFIFKNERGFDIFSQPLIYAGNNKVILCPTLVLRMNIVRTIELLATNIKLNKHIAQKGTDFENNLRFILSFNPHIDVNTNKMEFVSCDGKDIQYDFIAKFKDHLLLIEFKHLKIPFSDTEYKDALDIIKEGVHQVVRRANTYKKDWEKLKEQCSFKLPDDPIEEDKVIKLVCTNLLNFSTFILDDIEIMDSSSLLKFFMTPQVKGISVSSEVEELFQENLWKEQYPSVDEFKEFLKCPIAIKPYNGCFKGGYIPIYKIKEDDYDISFFNYNLIKDPYEDFYQKTVKSQPSLTKSIRIGRNDPCPCGSSKKYKKCCSNK